MQKLCRGSKFPQHVLSRTTETPKTHIQFNKKRKTISLGERTTGFIYGNKVQINKTPSTAYAK